MLSYLHPRKVFAMKAANVKIGWVRSPSSDVTSRKLVLTVDSEVTEIELGPEVESFDIQVKALSSVVFKTIVFDSEGNQAEASSYSFTLGDLEAPLPDTGLFHEILGVVDLPDPEPVP
jgi:hypothetical protein